MRLLVPVLLLACSADAQPPPPPPPTPPTRAAATPAPVPEGVDPARIEGSVISSTGEPIPRAQLRLGAPSAGGVPSSYTSTSGDDGTFVFENLPPGRNYRLTAQRPGYVTAQYGASSPTRIATPITLEAGQVLKDLTVTMIPQGVITGTVTTLDGDPAVGVQVQAMRYRYLQGRRQLAPSGGAATNDLGEYRLANLAPGQYYLSAINRRQVILATNAQPSGDQPEETDILTYFPNSADARGAAPINVTAGAELRGMDIRLLRGRTYRISGTVVDGTTGGAVVNVALTAIPKAEDNSGLNAFMRGGTQIARPPDAGFQFSGLQPGTYILQKANITLNGQALGEGLSGRMEVTITDQDVSGVVFPLGPGATISGTLSLEDGDIQTLLPGADAATNAFPPGLAGITPGRPGVRLMEASGTLNISGSAGEVKPDGSFEMTGVSPGTFSVMLTGMPPETYVKRIRFGGQDVTHAPLDLTSGAGGTLDILISNKAADVIGAVRNEDGEILAGTSVTLWPKQPDKGSLTNGVKPAITDQNGGFRLQGLAPGKYYLAAWEDVDTGLLQAYEFLNQFTSDAVEVELSEGAHAAHQLEAVPSAKIEAAIAKLP